MMDVAQTHVLYRIIGNDLWPRHRRGQSQDSVSFILDHEPDFPACTKHWIVNRIVNREAERAILDLLEERGQTYDRIPFDPAVYTQIGWDLDWVPTPGFLHSQEYQALPKRQRIVIEQRTRRLKANYVINVNGARNFALRQGRTLARWVLPWDGNCFLAEEAWRDLWAAVEAAPDALYVSVPMARVTDNRNVLDRSCAETAVEEPQLMFRADAGEEFDEAYPYGWRDKVELLRRLGVPGRWDGAVTHEVWDLPARPRSAEAGRYVTAGWVARLDSGRPHLDRGKSSLSLRGQARRDAIIATIDALDHDVLRQTCDPDSLTSYRPGLVELLSGAAPEEPLGLVVRRLWADADAATARGPYSVVDKPTPAPSSDPHDYFSLAPYWWPNPGTPDGLPYVRRDGWFFPPAAIGGSGSEDYDRTRLVACFDDATVCALAWAATGELRYARHGAHLLRAWFLEPATRMNPHLRHAQVRLGRDDGRCFGIIDLKNLHYLLDAVRLLHRSGELTAEDLAGLRTWLSAYRDWLVDSPFGRAEAARANNHGVFYDLQLGAVAAFLGDVATLGRIFRRFVERLPVHFTPAGTQQQEQLRADPRHYLCFNLQAWTGLALLAERCGVNLWDHATSDGRSLRRGLEAVLASPAAPTGHADPDEPFAEERVLPLRMVYDEHYAEPDTPVEILTKRYADVDLAVFPPPTAIRPYWFL